MYYIFLVDPVLPNKPTSIAQLFGADSDSDMSELSTGSLTPPSRAHSSKERERSQSLNASWLPDKSRPCGSKDRERSQSPIPFSNNNTSQSLNATQLPVRSTPCGSKERGRSRSPHKTGYNDANPSKKKNSSKGEFPMDNACKFLIFYTYSVY